MQGPTLYQGREVHSPLYWLMNSSFVLLGVAGGLGIWMLVRSLSASAYRRWLRVVGVLFGVGGVLVGLCPENSIELAHAGGAFLNIGGGNVLLILVGARGTDSGCRDGPRVSLWALALSVSWPWSSSWRYRPCSTAPSSAWPPILTCSRSACWRSLR